MISPVVAADLLEVGCGDAPPGECVNRIASHDAPRKVIFRKFQLGSGSNTTSGISRAVNFRC
jgi:hypothetical protein